MMTKKAEKALELCRWLNCTSPCDRRWDEKWEKMKEVFASFEAKDFCKEVVDATLAREKYPSNIQFVAVFKCGCETNIYRRGDIPTDASIISVVEAKKEEGKWTVKVGLDKPCFECGVKEMENAVDPAFSEASWVHSLDAYAGCDFESVYEHGMDLCSHPEWEVCCSEMGNPVGKIAIIVKGTVTGVFDFDCYSYVGAEGKRVNSRARFIGADFKDWTQKIKGGYAEVWVRDIEPLRIEIAPEIITHHPRRLEAVKKLARRNDLLVYCQERVVYDPGCDFGEVLSGETANMIKSHGYMEGWM
jgi:hypothetical protein